MKPLSVSMSFALGAAAALLFTSASAGAGERGRHRVYEYPPRTHAYAPPHHYSGHYGYAAVSRGDIPALLAAHGFTRIHDIDKDDDVYEVEARHVNGRKAEIEIDIATGRIIEIDWD